MREQDQSRAEGRRSCARRVEAPRGIARRPRASSSAGALRPFALRVWKAAGGRRRPAAARGEVPDAARR